MTSHAGSSTSDIGYATAEEPLSRKRTRRERSQDEPQSRKLKLAKVDKVLSALVTFGPFDTSTGATKAVAEHEDEFTLPPLIDYNTISPTLDPQGWKCPPPTGNSSPLSEISGTPSLPSQTDILQEGNGDLGEEPELIRQLQELLMQLQVNLAARGTEVAKRIEESLQAERSLRVEKVNIRRRCLSLVNEVMRTD